MSSQVLYVDFSADHSVRMTVGEAGRRPPEASLYHCDTLDDLSRALGDYLGRHSNPALIGAGLSICGWERDGAVDMPDHSYALHRDWIKQRLGIARVHLVNDCVATALAIERLREDERTVLHSGDDDPTQVKAMIAIGRSLGTTCIVTDELGATLALPCAGGHSDLPATTAREFAVVERMAARFGHVSRVRAVSTAGLADVYANLTAIDGRDVTAATPAEVITLAKGGDAHAAEAVAMVTGWLAATASDTALTVGARGGIFLAGSFFAVLDDLFDRDLFVHRFCAKGRLSRYLLDISVYLVNMREPEMVGLSTLFG